MLLSPTDALLSKVGGSVEVIVPRSSANQARILFWRDVRLWLTSSRNPMRNLLQPPAAFILLTALSLSIGWGIRGNFGHEYGAMIPGTLSAMAAVLLTARE